MTSRVDQSQARNKKRNLIARLRRFDRGQKGEEADPSPRCKSREDVDELTIERGSSEAVRLILLIVV